MRGSKARLNRFAVGTCIPLIALLLMGMAPALEGPTDSGSKGACEGWLPQSIPPVISASDSIFSYRPVAAPEALDQLGMGPEVTMSIEAPQRHEIKGRVTVETISFSLPEGAFEGADPLDYVIEVRVGNMTCSTDTWPLSVFITNESPEATRNWEPDRQQRLLSSAVTALLYATAMAGVPEDAYESTEMVENLCDALFESPTPCEWAAHLHHSDIGEESDAPPPPARVAEMDADDIGTLSTRCRTIRYRNVLDDQGYWWWGTFGELEPQGTWVTTQARARKSNANQNRIDLYSRVEAMFFASSTTTALAFGSVGFHHRILTPTPFVLRASLNSTVRGQGNVVADMVSAPNPFTEGTALAHSEASARNRISIVVPQSGGSASQQVFSDDIAASMGISEPGQTRATDYRYGAATVHLADMEMRDGYVVRYLIAGRAEAHARASGDAFAVATTDLREASPLGYVQANHVDLRIMSPSSVFWVDDGRCIEYW